MTIIRIGFTFRLRNITSITKNMSTAIQFIFENIELNCRVLVPKNASIIIVAAAEIIRPKDADFSPFNISRI